MTYRRMSTSTLRVFEGLLDRPLWRKLLWRQLAEIQVELLSRELAQLAEDADCYAVAPVSGVN